MGKHVILYDLKANEKSIEEALESWIYSKNFELLLDSFGKRLNRKLPLRTQINDLIEWATYQQDSEWEWT